MEALAACSVVGHAVIGFPSYSSSSSSSSRRKSRRRFFLSSRRPFFAPVSASSSSRDGPELDKWDQMELKFGRLLGEDPKLTLAKIMARKSNPDASYLDVEKSFEKNKGKIDEYMLNVPAAQPSPSAGLRKPIQKAAPQGAASANLARPVGSNGLKATRPLARPVPIEKRQDQVGGDSLGKAGVSDISLRKPSVPQDDDAEMEAKMKVKPNLFLKMRKNTDEDYSNMSLLKKPEVVKISSSPDQEGAERSTPIQIRPPNRGIQVSDESEISSDSTGKEETSSELPQSHSDGDDKTSGEQQKLSVGSPSSSIGDMRSGVLEGRSYVDGDDISSSSYLVDSMDVGLQSPPQLVAEMHDTEDSSTTLNANADISRQASLLGKPQRLGSPVKELPRVTNSEIVAIDDAPDPTSGTVIAAGQEELEDSIWERAANLLRSGEKVEVELISCSGRGFVVSFGSLIGFLPYKNLGSKWKFLAFESWLRKKGVDPSLYRKNLSIIGSYDVSTKNISSESIGPQEENQNDEILPTKRKYEDLLQEYDQEKAKFLSSFVGQRIRVSVVLADRSSRKLIFSGRPKESEELVEKKRSLMARLSIGDVVKCCIKKITYFGIFVEIEGVPALIHQSEVSWDDTLDPSAYFKIGQYVDAKVHQLDYALERIMLSLKDITPDPLSESLESVVGDPTSLVGTLEAAQADVEWADVELLIKELQKIDGVTGVYKGRFFISPGLAPTFQVYMASMFDDKYKLLARYENKVQEVMVEASLDKEQMKAAILTCTNRVI